MTWLKHVYRGGLYLTRRYLWPWGAVRVYLHTLHRGDDTPHFHNHPWKWAITIILWRGYTEERLYSGGEVGISRRRVRPGTVYLLRPGDFHRVEGIDPARPSWSLFLAGPRLDRPGGKAWGFRCPRCLQYTPEGRFRVQGSRCGHL